MRTWAPLLSLLVACGFHPSGTDGDAASGGDDAATVDGAGSDGTPGPDGAGPDARPIDAGIDAPACPGDYTASGGSRYALRRTLADLTTATADCADDLAGRTHLATFEAADLDAVLTALGADTGQELYIGGDCTGTGVDCDVRTNWVWHGTATAVDPSLWRTTEPSAGFERSYVDHQQANTWRMLSSPGVLDRQYVCECDP